MALVLLALVLASFTATTCYGQTITGQYDCLPAGAYTLCQNLWGEFAGVGEQNSTLVSASGNSVSWATNWSWANGPNNVKSYANVLHNIAKGMQLSAVKSAPTSWSWSYVTQSQGIRADVSYDIWFGTAQSGTAASSASSYEIIQPVGSQILSGLNIAGYTWNLWKGPNANWEVLSFVSAAGDITDFNADLNAFFTYLTQNQGVASSQYIQAIQTGTEPFVGSADLSIKNFTVSVNV